MKIKYFHFHCYYSWHVQNLRTPNTIHPAYFQIVLSLKPTLSKVQVWTYHLYSIRFSKKALIKIKFLLYKCLLKSIVSKVVLSLCSNRMVYPISFVYANNIKVRSPLWLFSCCTYLNFSDSSIFITRERGVLSEFLSIVLDIRL